jgi:hypothetical protein
MNIHFELKSSDLTKESDTVIEGVVCTRVLYAK